MGNDKRKQVKISHKKLNPSKNFNNKEDFRTKPKEGYILKKGTILESYPNTKFLVELDELETKIIATLSGRLRQNYIKILVGDKVEIELSVYDLTQGRISRRI